MIYLVQAFLLGDYNRTWNHNHLVHKQTLNHLAKLGFPAFLQNQSESKSSLNY